MTSATLTHLSTQDEPLDTISGTARPRLKVRFKSTTVSVNNTVDIAAYGDAIIGVDYVSLDGTTPAAGTAVTATGTAVTLVDIGVYEVGVIVRQA